MASQIVLILDFGGQYKELIARRVRECSVYSIVKSGDITPEEIRAALGTEDDRAADPGNGIVV